MVHSMRVPGPDSDSFSSDSGSAMTSLGRAKRKEYEDIYKKKLSTDKHEKVKKKVLIEWIVFWCLLGFVVASATIENLKHLMFWESDIWKWCVLVMVIFCGMLVTNWCMHFTVFVIERNILLKKK